MPRKPLDLKEGPTKYLDRPTNDGKHGDAADEPTEAVPAPESSTPEPSARHEPSAKARAK